jgi:branched-chain amino acid transport system ATP-binding protein
MSRTSSRFGGIAAVDYCSFTVPDGSITGLIGPNGAGKTTMFNVIGGVFAPGSGCVRFNGEDVTGLPPHLYSPRAWRAPSRSRTSSRA